MSIKTCSSMPSIWDTHKLLRSEGLDNAIPLLCLLKYKQLVWWAQVGFPPHLLLCLEVISGSVLVPQQRRLHLHLSRSLGTLTLSHGVKHRRLSMTLQPWSFYWGRDYTSTNGLSFDLPSGRHQHTLWTYYGTEESKRLLFYAWPLGGNMTLQT